MLDLGKKWTWVQIFENRGALMGCSNPHPHCQIWASSYLPNEPRIKDKNLKAYYNKHESPMLFDYMKKEVKKRVCIHTMKLYLVKIFISLFKHKYIIKFVGKNST